MSYPACFVPSSEKATALIPMHTDELRRWLVEQPQTTRSWLEANDFTAREGSFCLIPGEDGGVMSVIYGVPEQPDLWSLSGAPGKLPAGDYELVTHWDDVLREQATLGWALGAYRFDRYKKSEDSVARLVVSTLDSVLQAQIDAIYSVRTLINTPPDDMMPPELATETKALAEKYGAAFRQWIGDELLTENFPAIHAVGRASVHAPRLLELTWGDPEHPRLALVGKGVCFDTGGLDIKPSSGMRYMQKDMGGAAHVLGLAEMVMAANLPVSLQVLVPAVENAIAGNAFHPGDILDTRAGISVEVDNTDAEGRLVLCDAITYARETLPDLLIDFATLTGAARVAVGTEIACFFCNDRGLAGEVISCGEAQADPTWELPLHQPYRAMLDSDAADIVNCSQGGFGGAITAALFLKEFVGEGVDWLHFDVMAWNRRARPGRPKGGEAMGLRAMFDLLCERYPHA